MNKEEKQVFWYGIALAISGGILGNLFTALWSNRIINEVSKFSWGNLILWVVFGVISIIFILFLWWLIKKITFVNNIKRGRPKKKK